jgi:hypothetical protein
MEQMAVGSYKERASRDRLVEHMKSEIAELRKELVREDEGDPTS